MSHVFRAFAPNAPTGMRSCSPLYATVAAVAIFSGTLVMLQLSGPPAARATTAAAPIAATSLTTARTWDLEPRWWPGNPQPVRSGSVQRLERPSPTAPSTARTMVAESDLTFTKGYALRLAARRAAAAERIAATVPSAEGKAGRQIARSIPIARHASATPRTAAAPPPRSLAPVARIDAGVEPASPDVGSQTLAFDEPHPDQGVFPQPGLFPNIFGTLR